MNTTGPGTIERLLILLVILTVTVAPLAIAVIAGLASQSLLVGVAVLFLEIAVGGLVIRRRRHLTGV